MSFVSSVKTSFLLNRNWKLSLISQDEQLPFGFSSFVNLRNLNLLHSTLQATSKKHADLKQELEFQQDRFVESAHMKTQLAHQLLQEERNWKNSLEDAEKKKKITLSTYSLEYLELNLKIHQARRDLDSLGSSSIHSDHGDAFHSRIQSLEDQKVRLGESKARLMEATGEAQSLKEKPSSISDLVKRFQQARDIHQLASSRFHMAKTHCSNVNKDINQMNQLIQSISSTKDNVLPQVLTARFWINTVQVFVLGTKHSK